MEAKTNKVVVITGATRGLGKALAHSFALADYEVVGLYHSDVASATLLKSEFANRNLKGVFLKQDVTAEEGWVEFDEAMAPHEGKHLTLINNACAPFTPRPMHQISWPEFSSLLEVNVKGALLTFRRLLPRMVKPPGATFVSVLTSALAFPAKGFASYITAKSALEGLTRAVACEYGPRGIRSFSVSPDFMDTSLNAGWSDHLRVAILSKGKRPQDPINVAKSILSLVEDPATLGQGENYPLTDDQKA